MRDFGETASLPAAYRQVTSRAMLRRRIIAAVCSAALFMQTACYNAVPVEGVVAQPKGVVTININDRGRLLLGAKLGTLLDRLEGHVMRADSTSVDMAVATAVDARNARVNWGGERFVIPREAIGGMTEKKISRKRTFLLIGGIIAVIIVSATGLVKSVFGSGGPDTGTGPDPI